MSLTSDPRPESEYADRWQYELPRSAETRVGISFSGGGIRSATFCLGVYQRLAEAGIFQRARFLSAVSGGGYLAAGLAVSHAMAPEHATAGPPPWWRGSPEEERLRQNLSYLAPGGAGRLWLLANLLYGAVLNLTPLVLSAYLLGHLTGLLFRVLYPGLGTEGPVDLFAAPWVGAGIGAAICGSVLVVGWRRFRDKQQSRVGRSKEPHSELLSNALLVGAAVAFAVLVVLPLVIDRLAGATTGAATFLRLEELPVGPQRFLLGVAGVSCGLAVGGVAVWLLQRRMLPHLRALLAGVAGVAVLLVPFVLATETGTVRPWSLRGDGPSLLGALVIVLLFAVLAHNRRYSMHLFYRERIQEAFTSTRAPHPDGEGANGGSRARTIPYSERILLSRIAAINAQRAAGAGPRFPELVVCAAVAARGAEVPNKAWAASFTFEGECAGNVRLGLDADTRELEGGDWIGGGGLTLPSMMAISGAALSPMMGRFTLPAFRFLMAVMNIRLGVWVRNPDKYLETELPGWNRPARRIWRYIVRGWREPGAWYVLKEGLGLANAHGRYIFVSDGGHWENLGLTELFRRRCTHIIAIDASGNSSLTDIGRAMSVARAELGVEVNLDPRGAASGAEGLAPAPVVVGTFDYPDGQHGKIYFARSALWEGAPVDLRLFAEHEKLFPNHPTANQFLSGEVFDAYRALGWAIGGELEARIHLPPPMFDEPRRATHLLAPIVAHDLKVLFVGVDPSRRSTEVGHHFARPNNRFYSALHAGGFTPRRLLPSEDRELTRYGLGITNLVTRPSAVGDLEETVRALKPRLVAILGLTAYRTAFDRPGASLGLQEETLGGQPVWVLPNPCGDDQHHRPQDFARCYAAARERAEQDVKRPFFPSGERTGSESRPALVNGQESLADG